MQAATDMEIVTKTEGRKGKGDPKLGPAQLAKVQKACRLIEESPGEMPSLAQLAQEVDLSPWHFQKLFKKATGVSPRAYAAAQRAETFRSKLKNGDNIAGASYEAGFGSSSRLYEKAKAWLGMTPASYAKGGRGAVIYFATLSSDLGRLLVAATEKGICFVSLRDSDSELEAELHKEFPKATAIVRNDEAIAPAVKSLLDYFNGKAPHFDLPLDIRATAFQFRVWQELLAIPAGETASYSEIAERIGHPKAQRAVGSACGRNPVPLIIPCHRALRSDGSYGGYRMGVKRKEAILRHEKSAFRS
jgi:AraC family transcriptional regulator of adaptative response/methylated-DNA-[protein]-cysteine methyltransferase